MKDDVTGEPLTRREDDTAEVFTKRLRSFHKATKPLVEHYIATGRYLSIDANQKSSAVSVQLVSALRARGGQFI